MARVTLKNITKQYGNVKAVSNVDLTIDDKEFVVLLGPSGCGKTTTLRCIVGLETLTKGHIFFDDERVDQIDPAGRNVAMVFQFFALYPHLRAKKIITFPLRARKLPKKKIQKKLDWVTEIFKLHDLLDRHVGGMPPGDMQKIALARAVVRDPNVLLLDEPLSALDEKYREQMRWELGHMQKELQVTTIYVTHDQREAMALADRIILMRDGKIVQKGPPEEIYQNPINVFSGHFIGSPGMNFFDGKLEGSQLLLGEEKRPLLLSDRNIDLLQKNNVQDVIIGIRPEYLSCFQEKRSDDIGFLPADIHYSKTTGHHSRFSFKIDQKIVQGLAHNGTAINGNGFVRFDMKNIRFFNPQTEESIR